jgi:hypothetical protein
MRNDLEILIKLIIPAIVLIGWAINQVSNREAPAPPRRPFPPGPPPPPGGGLPPAPMPGERAGPREVIWTEAPPPPPRRELPAGPDEILILGTETRPVKPPPPSPGRPSVSPRSRSPRRPRAAQPPRPELSRPRPGLAGDLARGPDTLPAAPEPPAARSPDRLTAPALDPAQLRAAIASPARIREAIVLNELLQPPLSVRRARRRF